MKPIIYKHKPIMLIGGILFSIFLIILISLQIYLLGKKNGFSGYEFYFSLSICLVLITNTLFLIYNISEQTIEINPEIQSLVLSHKSKRHFSKVIIPFEQIEKISIVLLEPSEYDIEIFLKDKKQFYLFSYGDYCPKTQESIKSELMKIETLIFPKNNNFIYL